MFSKFLKYSHAPEPAIRKFNGNFSPHTCQTTRQTLAKHCKKNGNRKVVSWPTPLWRHSSWLYHFRPLTRDPNYLDPQPCVYPWLRLRWSENLKCFEREQHLLFETCMSSWVWDVATLSPIPHSKTWAQIRCTSHDIGRWEIWVWLGQHHQHR